MPILETEKLVMRFGGVAAVCDVSIAVEPGEIRCIIGPNGAGKSTLFKMITGQYRPTAGRVFFKGEDITGLRTWRIARRGIGIKMQVPRLYDNLTLRENIWIGARSASDPAAVVEAVIDKIGLRGLEQVPVGKLAHGQRQWVDLGGILAGEPELILLDEPAAGLSDEEVDRTAALIRIISRIHTVVVVEHDMRFIRAIGSRVTVLHQGAVFADGPVDRILNDPAVQDVYLGRRVRHVA